MSTDLDAQIDQCRKDIAKALRRLQEYVKEQEKKQEPHQFDCPMGISFLESGKVLIKHRSSDVNVVDDLTDAALLINVKLDWLEQISS